MAEIELALNLLIIDQILDDSDKKRIRKNRKIWMKEWLKRKDYFSNEKLVKSLRISEPADYRNFLRMNDDGFQELLAKVTPIIKKSDTTMRDAISAETRLSITLRYLAKGNDFEDLKFFYAVSPQAIGQIVIETCQAIIKVLKDQIKLPGTPDEWKLVANHFYAVSSFPHCLGAIDGKHIEIKKPSHSGSYYFNYKKTFSIVLMAIVNANYEFIMVDVGKNGRISDGGVFGSTKFSRMLEDGLLNIPEPEACVVNGPKLPYVFVADDAFPLRENIMKPYSSANLSAEQELFNKTLSSSRVRVENTFGIVANRFEVLLKPIKLSPEKASIIVLACCYLHNYLRRKSGFSYTVLDATENQQMAVNLESTQAKNSSNASKEIRNQFCNFINSSAHDE